MQTRICSGALGIIKTTWLRRCLLIRTYEQVRRKMTNRWKFRAYFCSTCRNHIVLYLFYGNNFLRFFENFNGVSRDFARTFAAQLLATAQSQVVSDIPFCRVGLISLYNPRQKSLCASMSTLGKPALTSVLFGIEIAIKNMTKAQHRRCFDEWFERMDKCMKAKGVYFESCNSF